MIVQIANASDGTVVFIVSNIPTRSRCRNEERTREGLPLRSKREEKLPVPKCLHTVLSVMNVKK